MSLALNEQNRLLFIQIQALSLSMHHRWKEIPDFICKITNGKLYGINSKQKVPLSLRITNILTKQNIFYLQDFRFVNYVSPKFSVFFIKYSKMIYCNV